MPATPARYPLSLIALHWLMALALLGMVGSGLLSTSGWLEPMQTYQLIQWHKAFGVMLLGLVVLRIIVRGAAVLRGRIPALPHSMKPLEATAAHLGHWALYGLMLAIPLSGWLMVSASPYGLPTVLFGETIWPHIPMVAGVTWVYELANESHELLAYALMLLVAIHIGAVVKHSLTEGLNLLPRMGIGRSTPSSSQ